MRLPEQGSPGPSFNLRRHSTRGERGHGHSFVGLGERAQQPVEVAVHDLGERYGDELALRHRVGVIAYSQ